MSSIADVLSPEAKAHTAQKGSTNANGFTDYFDLDGLLTEEHILVRQSMRDFVKREILPSIEQWAQQAYFPSEIVRKFGDVGAFGPTIPQEYGGGGMDYISYGLIMQEIERGDSGMRSTASVQGSLVMFPIYQYGSEEQRRKYLPKLASGEWLGCFGLTAVVWAKNEQGRIKGVIVERGMEGFTTPEIHNKWSLRASITGELVFDNVRIPRENILPNVEGLRGPLSCLDSARFGIAWGAIGAAIDCYESALKYSLQREQFGKPIASFQLQQKKLAEMITEITKAQLLTWRLGVLKNEGKATSAQISMAKRNSVDMALHVAREARQIHGGMGITGEYPIMRHMMNLESVVTYEGTHDIHLLITGADITGIQAFK
jgi:glutaryl-CoA dehydrogenase